METDQAWATRGRRQIRKLRDKKEWFQKKTEEQNLTLNDTKNSWRHSHKTSPATTADRGPPIFKLYVPATPEGELARRLQEAEHQFSTLYKQGWTKIIERGGTKLNVLLPTNIHGLR